MAAALPTYQDNTATLRDRAGARRQASRLYVLSLILVDLAVVGIAMAVALVGRVEMGLFDGGAGDLSDVLAPVAALLALTWILLIALAGGYSSRQLGVGTVEYKRVLNASLLMAGAVGVAAYLTQYPLSRGFSFLFFTAGIPLLMLGRHLVRRIVHRVRHSGRLQSSVLIAGDLDHIDDVAAVLTRERWLGYEVVGALAADPSVDETQAGIPVFGAPEDAVSVLTAVGASAVIFTDGAFRRGRDFNELARELENVHANTIVVPSLTDISASRMDIRPVAGIPLVHIEQPRSAAAGRQMKRIFDLIGSTALILLGAPVMAVVAAAIKLGDGGPVLFKQERAGHEGRPFTCYKFRSMVPDAEQRLRGLADQNNHDGVLFKMRRDPRITAVGAVIRRFSLDELPQLFNVWRGDMSLVGPRPALTAEVERYKSHVRRRLDVRPGMTGLWQVSGRSDLSWDDTVRLDLYYVDNWSMVQDLTILVRTFGAVVSSRGAY
ncbi:MAG: sugar transferase [Propioniciclava sp.]